MNHRLVSALGFIVFAFIAWLFSNNRRSVPWKTVGAGLGLQVLLGVLIFRFPGSHRAFLWMNDAVLALLDASKVSATTCPHSLRLQARSNSTIRSFPLDSA